MPNHEETGFDRAGNFAGNCLLLNRQDHGEYFFVVVCTVLRALSRNSNLSIPSSISWEYLTTSTASNALQRVSKCCDEIDEDNFAIFKGNLKRVARSGLGEGKQVSATLVKLLDAATRVNCREFSQDEWCSVSQFLAASYTDETNEFDPMVLSALKEFMPDGTCLVVGDIRGNWSVLNKFPMRCEKGFRLFVRELSDNFYRKAVTQLITWIGSFDNAVAYDSSYERKYSAALIVFPSDSVKRRTAEQIRMQTYAIRRTYDVLKESGILLAVVPDGILIGGGIEEDFRRLIAGRRALHSVVHLPTENGFRTAASFSLVTMLKHDRPDPDSVVKFVDATSMLTSLRDPSDKTANAQTGKSALLKILREPESGEFHESKWNLSISIDDILKDTNCSWDMAKYKYMAEAAEPGGSDCRLSERLLEKIRERDILSKNLAMMFETFRH